MHLAFAAFIAFWAFIKILYIAANKDSFINVVKKEAIFDYFCPTNLALTIIY
jgi:hypothetical protein